MHGICSNCCSVESFLFVRSPDILALCENNLKFSIYSTEFSVPGCLSLFRKKTLVFTSISLTSTFATGKWIDSWVSRLFLCEFPTFTNKLNVIILSFFVTLPLITVACQIEFTRFQISLYSMTSMSIMSSTFLTLLTTLASRWCLSRLLNHSLK